MRCTTCGDYAGTMPSRHRCAPIWRVWCEDYGHDEDRDGREIRAVSAPIAAERWAEQQDNLGDYKIIGGRDVVVAVRPRAGGAVSRWKVIGVPVPTYQARPAGGAS